MKAEGLMGFLFSDASCYDKPARILESAARQGNALSGLMYILYDTNEKEGKGETCKGRHVLTQSLNTV